MAIDRRSFSPVQKLVLSEVLIVVLIVLSFIVFGWMFAKRPVVAEKEITPVRLNVDVFQVQEVTFQEVLGGFGTAQADREVVLSAQVTGEVVDINPQLKTGSSVSGAQVTTSPDRPSTVADGELLLRIDPRNYLRSVELATNRIAEAQTEIERLKVQQTNVARQLTTAQSVLETLKDDYNRVQRLAERNAASASDLNRASLELQRYQDAIIQLENQTALIPHQLAAAEQRLDSSRSEKRRAEEDLEKTEVRPPFSGVLSDVFVEKGQFVRPGENLVRLTDLTRVEVPVALPLDDFLQLEQDLNAGQKPKVALAPNETTAPLWNGTVVRAAPEADPVSRTVQVFVEVDNNQAVPLLPGTFVHARINGQVWAQTRLIPREAVVEGQVYVVDDQNIARRRPITIGRRLQSLAIVTDGLQPGDRVILTNLDIVEEGTQLVVQDVLNVSDELQSLRTPVIRLTENSPL